MTSCAVIARTVPRGNMSGLSSQALTARTASGQSTETLLDMTFGMLVLIASRNGSRRR